MLNAALDRYLNVVYGKNLRDGERPDPFWIKEAGLAAARVLETRGQWNESINLYRRLQDLVPSLRPVLETQQAWKPALEPATRPPFFVAPSRPPTPHV